MNATTAIANSKLGKLLELEAAEVALGFGAGTLLAGGKVIIMDGNNIPSVPDGFDSDACGRVAVWVTGTLCVMLAVTRFVEVLSTGLDSTGLLSTGLLWDGVLSTGLLWAGVDWTGELCTGVL